MSASFPLKMGELAESAARRGVKGSSIS